jgi:hypothetical protein
MMVFFFLLYFVFALAERKNEVQKMVSTLLPQAKKCLHGQVRKFYQQ